MSVSKTSRRNKIRARIRGIVFGTNDSPRISVFRSNKQIYAQLVDDQKGVTLLAASSRDKGFEVSGNKIEVAKQVGKALGEKAVKAGYSAAKFDRNGYLYHGRVKALADGAREAGLNF